MIDWKRKLTSRKLWLAVASLVANIILACGGSETVAVQVTAIIMGGATVIGYLLAEGLADAAHVETTETQTANGNVMVSDAIGFDLGGESND